MIHPSRAKNQLLLKSRLKGATLGDAEPTSSSTGESAEGGELSARAWLKRSKKLQKEREKEIALVKKREEEEKEREREAVYGEGTLNMPYFQFDVRKRGLIAITFMFNFLLRFLSNLFLPQRTSGDSKSPTQPKTSPP